MIVNTNEESPKDDKEEGGKTEKDLFDIDGLVDKGEHTVVEDDRDAVVEERLTKDKEVEAGVHLLISILNLRQLNAISWTPLSPQILPRLPLGPQRISSLQKAGPDKTKDNNSKPLRNLSPQKMELNIKPGLAPAFVQVSPEHQLGQDHRERSQ